MDGNGNDVEGDSGSEIHENNLYDATDVDDKNNGTDDTHLSVHWHKSFYTSESCKEHKQRVRKSSPHVVIFLLYPQLSIGDHDSSAG